MKSCSNKQMNRCISKPRKEGRQQIDGWPDKWTEVGKKDGQTDESMD